MGDSLCDVFERGERGVIAILLLALGVGCGHDATNAAEVRANLSAAGYTLGASSSPDPRAAPYPSVVRSECFDATSGETVRVCVWIWPDALPDTFPLEEFTQSEEAFTESRNACFVIVTPSGDADSLGFRTGRRVWRR